MSHHSRVVLTEDMPNLGKSGELVRVRAGFARNYLLPRGLAIGATEENVAQIEHAKRVAEARATKLKSEAEQLAATLKTVKLTLSRPAGEGDKLYGAVTSRDIEEALRNAGYQVDKRRIELEPIKVLGTFPVTIRLATSVSATIEVTVQAKSN